MDIRKIACIGAGAMGHNYAALFASKGYEVHLQSRTEERLEQALKQIKSELLFLEENNLIEPGWAESSLVRVHPTTEMEEALSSVDYVQESTPDFYDVKKKVYREMEVYAPKYAILASSSGGLLMTEIQKKAKHPERCIIVHNNNPPLLMPLAEVVPGELTSTETVNITRSFWECIGKKPITVNKEVRGYVHNRLYFLLLREAMDMVSKGVVSAEDLDEALRYSLGIRLIAGRGPMLSLFMKGKSEKSEDPRDATEKCLEYYSQILPGMWRTYATWDEIPYNVVKGVDKSVKKMKLVKEEVSETDFNVNLIEAQKFLEHKMRTS